MLPPSRKIFRSRWKAAFWAAMVCVSAVEFAGGRDKGGDDAPSSTTDLNAAVDALDLP